MIKKAQKKTTLKNKRCFPSNSTSETQVQAITEQEKPTEKKSAKVDTSQVKQESKEVLSSASKSEENKQEETAPIEEETEIVTQTETQTTVIEDKQEEKIYCVDGGKTHMLGDGENEHGYYKTW